MTRRRDGLAHRREALGYTQEQLAELIDSDARTVSRWERGVTRPRTDNRRPLAHTLKLSLTELDQLLRPVERDGARGVADVHAPPPSATPGAGLELDVVLNHLREQWHVLVQADNLWGPAHALRGVLEQIQLIEGLLEPKTGRDWQQLARLAARYGESASWLYEDLNDLPASRMWIIRAREWARAAADGEMTAWTDYRRSQLAATNGDAEHALGLAALASGNGAPLPSTMSAALAVAQGLAYAALGEGASCHQLLDAAQTQASTDMLGDAREGHGAFVTPAYVELHRAWCHTLLGQPAHALSQFDQHLATLPAAYRRDRGVTLARLAHTHFQAGDLSQAANTAQQALTIADEVGSQRTIHHVRSVAQSMSQHRRQPQVADLVEQLQDKGVSW